MNFSEKERKFIYLLAEKVSGIHQTSHFDGSSLLSDVASRMKKNKLRSLKDYLLFIEDHPDEFDNLISALTIHTTSWFREAPHFDVLEKYLGKFEPSIHKKHLKILSVGCSTGQEVYSLAAYLSNYTRSKPHISFEILGVDVDPVSVSVCQRSVYDAKDFDFIPKQFQVFFQRGRGDAQHLFVPKRQLRDACQFQISNAKNFILSQTTKYDIIFCRNMLIYLRKDHVKEIVVGLEKLLTQDGIMFLGHSESIASTYLSLESLGHAAYQWPAHESKPEAEAPKLVKKKSGIPERILIVDDDPDILELLKDLLEIKGIYCDTADSVKRAFSYLDKRQYFLVITDYKMPQKTGLDFLQEARPIYPNLPFVLISGYADVSIKNNPVRDHFQAFLDKPIDIEKIIELVAIFRKATIAQKYDPDLIAAKNANVDAILIGASTGGTKIIHEVLEDISPDTPPIILVQHIPDQFAISMSEGIAKKASLINPTPTEGLKLEPGHLYTAHGDYHLGLKRMVGDLALTISKSAPEKNLRPSVNHLFQSAAQLSKYNFAAILLTGMGSDGAEAMVQLRSQKHLTIAQEPCTCVVFGMPREAIRLDAASIVATPAKINQLIRRIATRKKMAS